MSLSHGLSRCYSIWPLQVAMFTRAHRVPDISQAVMQLFTSRGEQKHLARSIAMMRHGFGGHPYGVDQAIVRERREGRVGDFLREKV